MGRHSIGAHDFPAEEIDLSDEAGWLYREALPDLLDDGKLTKENVTHAKRVGLALVEGLALTVALAAGPAVWDEVQNGNLDLPSLLNVAYTYGVAAGGSYLRRLKK